MTEKRRYGFAALTPERRQTLARLGGQMAHRKGVAYEWTSESARAAGRKGGAVRAERLRAARVSPKETPTGEATDVSLPM
jgi:general stress protein YciG